MFAHMSKKQANVLYRAAKSNEISINKDLISFAYHRAGQMHSWSAIDDGAETYLLRAIDCIFAGDREAAQELIDSAWTEYGAAHGLLKTEGC